VHSLLELLHPDGDVGMAVVLGTGAPGRLLPSNDVLSTAGPADLVLVAPSPKEAAEAAWLEDAAAAAAAAVAAHGLVYVLARPRARRRLRSLLARHGLRAAASFLHVPDAETTRQLVPLERGPFRYAFSSLIPVSARTRRLETAVRRLPSLAPVAWSAGAVGTAFVRPGARAPMTWMLPRELGAATAILARPHADGAAPIVHAFPARGSRPVFVAKLTRAGAGAQALVRLGPAAAAAGATVPQVMASELSGRPAVVESVVPGRNAYALLVAQPQRFESVGAALTGWLERWNAATAVEHALTRELLEDAIIEPAALLEHDLRRGPSARRRLEELCARIEGTRIPLVAVHGDLTMSNVLVDGDRVGIVDWEHAAERGLPLTDFVYAVADAAAARTAYADRVAAARACFDPDGRDAAIVTGWQLRLASALGLGDDLRELCFHACWLHHAANEAQRARNEEPRPFLALVDWATERVR
jgi:hypothetical protein